MSPGCLGPVRTAQCERFQTKMLGSFSHILVTLTHVSFNLLLVNEMSLLFRHVLVFSFSQNADSL